MSSRPRVSKSERAGLVFPVARVRAMLAVRNASSSTSDRAAVALASVLEYVTAELLELARNAAATEQRRRIQPRDVNLAVRTDPELCKVFARGIIGNSTFVSAHPQAHPAPPARGASSRAAGASNRRRVQVRKVKKEVTSGSSQGTSRLRGGATSPMEASPSHGVRKGRAPGSQTGDQGSRSSSRHWGPSTSSESDSLRATGSHLRSSSSPRVPNIQNAVETDCMRLRNGKVLKSPGSQPGSQRSRSRSPRRGASPTSAADFSRLTVSHPRTSSPQTSEARNAGGTDRMSLRNGKVLKSLGSQAGSQRWSSRSPPPSAADFSRLTPSRPRTLQPPATTSMTLRNGKVLKKFGSVPGKQSTRGRDVRRGVATRSAPDFQLVQPCLLRSRRPLIRNAVMENRYKNAGRKVHADVIEARNFTFVTKKVFKGL